MCHVLCGTLHLVWNGAWHCYSAIQRLLPGAGTSAAVMHAATDTESTPIKKKKNPSFFLIEPWVITLTIVL